MARGNYVTVFLLIISCAAGQAQTKRLDLDTREEVAKVPMVVKNLFGVEIKGDVTLTTFRPSGPGPFPLVVVGHGRPGGELDRRSKVERQRFDSAARFFVRKGFAVAVPMRLGYGDTAELGDPEDSIYCEQAKYGAALDAAGDQTLAIVAYMRKQPHVDPTKLVLIGQSLGGSASIAATSKHPTGLIASLNFAGGHGGRRDQLGEPCAPWLLTRAFSKYGEESAKGPVVPTLWVYTENDAFFSPKYSKAWADAYVKGGGTAEFMLLPPVGQNGHVMFYTSADLWQPIVDKFLAKYGFLDPGVIPKPASTNFAKLDDVAALPYVGDLKLARDNYAKFLTLPKPRAFAVGSNRYHGFSSGDDAMSRALSACQRETGAPCKLYAVDDNVVWQP